MGWKYLFRRNWENPFVNFYCSRDVVNREKTCDSEKFYKNHLDEHNLIKKYFKSLILEKNRLLGVKSLWTKFDTIILDDGFQDAKIKKHLNIICFNEKQLVGNGLVFPQVRLEKA